MCLLLYTADLPVCSPLCHAVLKTLQRWEQVLQKRLEIFGGAPSRYISAHLQDETALPGPALLKHKALFEPSNMPFRYSHKKSSIGLICISFCNLQIVPWQIWPLVYLLNKHLASCQSFTPVFYKEKAWLIHIQIYHSSFRQHKLIVRCCCSADYC